MRDTQPTMVLVELDEHGEVPTGRPWFTTDKRIPRTLGIDHEVHAVGDWRAGHDTSQACRVSGTDTTPRMRHLFDILESSREYDVEPPDNDLDDDGAWTTEQRFIAHLTCVRCGLVLTWDGTRTAETAASIDPTPLASGQLVAQQTETLTFFRHVDTTWAVHLRSGPRVGVITWSRGPRGREFYQGRLRLNPNGELSDDILVEADTPAKVLRKLARAHQNADVPTVQVS